MGQSSGGRAGWAGGWRVGSFLRCPSLFLKAPGKQLSCFLSRFCFETTQIDQRTARSPGHQHTDPSIKRPRDATQPGQKQRTRRRRGAKNQQQRASKRASEPSEQASKGANKRAKGAKGANENNHQSKLLKPGSQKCVAAKQSKAKQSNSSKQAGLQACR